MITLDFGVRTLLIYALKAEATILRQHFPTAKNIFSQNGIELLKTDSEYDLFKIGMGLSSANTALSILPSPYQYDKVIHFGVSGSLTESIPIESIVYSRSFSAFEKDTINLASTMAYTLPQAKRVNYYSSVEAVNTESLRRIAASSGAQVVDMESYAIATFCEKNKLPLLALRCISDRAGASTPADFRTHFKAASAKLQNYILKHIVKR